MGSYIWTLCINRQTVKTGQTGRMHRQIRVFARCACPFYFTIQNSLTNSVKSALGCTMGDFMNFDHMIMTS